MESLEFAGEFPAEPDAEEAAGAAEKEGAEEAEPESVAREPASVADDEGSGENAEFVHGVAGERRVIADFAHRMARFAQTGSPVRSLLSACSILRFPHS